MDQGNRKAYDVERALMAENSWATNSIIWEGYSRSPTVVSLLNPRVVEHLGGM